jgi:hypothetical protein
MKLLRPYTLAIATFVIVAAMAGLGLINTWLWYSTLPAFMAEAKLPASFWIRVGGLAIQLLACLSGLSTVLFRKASLARTVTLLALVALVLVHFGRWGLLSSPPVSGFLAYSLRIAFAAWLVFLLYRLAHNKSFKPNPLRGSA